MLVSDFDFQLPAELIAQQPAADRADSRMLTVRRAEQKWEDRLFRDFPAFLSAGDCLVVNDSRVFPSRVFATRSSGPARIEVFLIRPLDDDRRWEALVRPGRKVPVGERLSFAGGLEADVTARGEHGLRVINFSGRENVYEMLDRIGHVPLPPYVTRDDVPEDRERYQTVYARERGSVAAPTAGLHFTPELLAECRNAGADIARVTLHVGLGTFAPLAHDEVEQNRLHSERYSIEAGDLERIRAAKRRVAVGTTTARTLETVGAGGAAAGETDIFIYPGYRFTAVDVLLTNFHLPRSSLLMLAAAFAGRDLILAAYNHAVRERYRFFSYGDCMLIV